MSLKLPLPPDSYSRGYEDERNRALEQADARSYKRGQDVELGDAASVVLRSPNGERWKITVADDGTLSAVAA